VTRGVRVDVEPEYMPSHGVKHESWEQPAYVFGYHIRITNEGPRTVKLISRHWTIVDADGERHEVRGDGVVGYQPELRPGEFFEYSSHCPMPTAWGTMEGEYQMQDASGEGFEVQVARFYLVAPERGPVPGSR